MKISNCTQIPLATRIHHLKPSLIRDIAEEGMALDDVRPLWFGEGTWATPRLAIDAAKTALEQGDHFYQPNSGKPILRSEIALYLSRLYGCELDQERITVTASGMQGLALTAQAIVNPGDRVVTLTPAWPNIAAAFQIAGAEVHFEKLRVRNGRWYLDLDKLLSVLRPGTKAVVLNSPHNPTGWTMPADDLRSLLEHCRRHGIWIVSDEVYSRLYSAARAAPSLVEFAEPDDLVISINSFSKAWSMTGWRLGWICAPSWLTPVLSMLTEFNIAGPAGFVQAAGTQMIRDGEWSIAQLRTRLKESYALTERALRSIEEVEFVRPEGAFYCFFRVAGMSDSVEAARRLMHEGKIGLAPGAAFGAAGEGFLRLCYAKPATTMTAALDRLVSTIPSVLK